MDNDTLDAMNELKRAAIAIVDGLRRLAPATVKNSVGGGNARRRRRLGVAHHRNQHIQRRAGVAARQRANFGKSFGHFVFQIFEERAPAPSRKSGGALNSFVSEGLQAVRPGSQLADTDLVAWPTSSR